MQFFPLTLLKEISYKSQIIKFQWVILAFLSNEIIELNILFLCSLTLFLELFGLLFQCLVEIKNYKAE